MRRIVRMALAALMLVAGVVGLQVGLGSTTALAAGVYPVGATPIALTQPADANVGVLTPSADATTAGMFAPQVAWPIIPVHTVLTTTGRLVSYGSPINVVAQEGLTFDEWNPAQGYGATAHSQTRSMSTYNAFCNSLMTLADGRILMVGGNSEKEMSHGTMYYDPATRATAMGAPLNLQRWYASTMRLPDDRILVLGGANYYNTGAFTKPNDNTGVGITPEIGSGTGAWSLLNGATNTTAFGAANNRWWYPRAFNAPDGQVFGITANQMWRLNPNGNGSTTILGTIPKSIGVSGAAVMYAPGKLLLAGGGQDFNADGIVATNAATTIDISGANPVVASVAPMTFARNWVNLTVLPTGDVLANGGTRVGTQGGADSSVYATEIWNPTTKTWRTGASAKRIRTYHSTAVLMPGGGVFTGGGGIPGPEDNFNAEMYYPSSLFTKDATGKVVWAARPTINSIAGDVTRGGTIKLTVTSGKPISQLSLISTAQETHSVNQDQRRIPLNFTQNGNTLTATIPAGVNNVTAGNYLLSAVDNAGVPSPSQIVTFRNGAAGTVTVFETDNSGGNPGGGGGTSDGSVPLTVGSSVGLQPVNFPAYLVRQANLAARIDPISATSSTTDRADASYVVRNGLASASAVSFESVRLPGYYLQNVNGVVKFAKNDGSAGFAGSASFLPVTGLTGQNTSFTVYNDQTLYLRHTGYVLYAQKSDGSDGFRKDSTFSVRKALADSAPSAGLLTPGTKIGLQPGGAAGYLVRHQNYLARVDKIGANDAAGLRADATFTVRAGLSNQSGVSFEAVNFPGYFLTSATGGRVTLKQSNGSAAFNTSATYTAQTGLNGSGTSFASISDPTAFVRVQNSLVSTVKNDGTTAFKQSASFVVQPGIG